MRTVILGAALALALADGAAALPWSSPPQQVAATPEEQLLEQAQQHISRNEFGAAGDLLASAVASPDFSKLDPGKQHWTLYALSAVELSQGDSKSALAHAKRAVGMPQATSADWWTLLRAALRERVVADQADAVASIARLSPSLLKQIPDRYFRQLVRDLDKSNEKQRRLAMLSALFESHWRSQDPFEDDSMLWYGLALDQLQAGNAPAALAAARSITDDKVVLRMQVDKRFDAIIASEPARFDPRTVAESKLQYLQSQSNAAPDRLKGPENTADQLMTLGRDQEALELIDAALAKVSLTESSPKVFSDQADRLEWAMEARSDVLARLGRFDEAVAQERKAAEQVENGQLNISQMLNLGGLLVSLDRPQEALAAIQPGVEREMAPYGRMVYWDVRACASAELHDEKAASEALDYLRAHAADGRRPLRSALLCVDDEAGLAKEMIGELADPDARADLLVALQTYDPEPHETPHQHLIRSRQKAVAARPDVRAAIDAVGHLRTFHVS